MYDIIHCASLRRTVSTVYVRICTPMTHSLTGGFTAPAIRSCCDRWLRALISWRRGYSQWYPICNSMDTVNQSECHAESWRRRQSQHSSLFGRCVFAMKSSGCEVKSRTLSPLSQLYRAKPVVPVLRDRCSCIGLYTTVYIIMLVERFVLTEIKIIVVIIFFGKLLSFRGNQTRALWQNGIKICADFFTPYER